MLMRRCTVSAAMWIKLRTPLRCSVQRGCETNLRNIIFDAEWVEIIVFSLKWRFDHVRENIFLSGYDQHLQERLLADERRFYLRCCARHAAPLPPYVFSQDEPHRLIEAAGLVRRTR